MYEVHQIIYAFALSLSLSIPVAGFEPFINGFGSHMFYHSASSPQPIIDNFV